MPGNVKALLSLGARVRQAQDRLLHGPEGGKALQEARAMWTSTPSALTTNRRAAGWPLVGRRRFSRCGRGVGLLFLHAP